MKRAITAAAVTVAMFAAGSTGLLRRLQEQAPRAVVAGGASGFLGPGGSGGLDGIISSLQSRLAVRPNDWRAQASLGLAYLQKGRGTANPSYFSKAEGVLLRSLDLGERQNFDGLLGMAALALGRHDFSAALEWSRRAQEVNPSSAPAAGLTGDALLELGRYGAAAAALQRMIDLRPDVSTYARVSYFREMRGDWPGAVEAMTLARDAASDPADLGWTGFRLGELYFAAGRTGPALREYRRAAELAPDHVLPPVGLAKVAAARGELDRATGLLNQVVGRYPYPEFVILLGDLYREAGQPAKAREQYGLVEAIDRLYRAGGVNTDLEMALFRADHRVGLPDSLARARAEYARRPSLVAADTLGWVLYATGRFREADRYAREALRFDTPNALFRFHAGMIAVRLGEKGVARRRLAEALSLNPNFSFRYRDLALRTLERLS